MKALQDLENWLNEIFGKKAPTLPEGGKKFVVKYLPWFSLMVGILTLYGVYLLWHWAHWANQAASYVNSWNAYYGQPLIHLNHMTAVLWLGLLVLTAEAVVYLAAFPATRARRKQGWNLLFYATLINIVYGFLVMFTSYGNVGSFIGGIVSSAGGFYFLFQVRDRYKH